MKIGSSLALIGSRDPGFAVTGDSLVIQLAHRRLGPQFIRRDRANASQHAQRGWLGRRYWCAGATQAAGSRSPGPPVRRRNRALGNQRDAVARTPCLNTGDGCGHIRRVKPATWFSRLGPDGRLRPYGSQSRFQLTTGVVVCAADLGYQHRITRNLIEYSKLYTCLAARTSGLVQAALRKWQ